jgi:beta-galactosidase
VRKFDHKTTTDGREYLETTEPTGDDKTVTSGPFPGSYTSPNGSAGKLHLTWKVPFAPGRLVAVARRDGAVVARDAIETAGKADRLALTPDRTVMPADGRSLAFVTVDVQDRRGVLVPDADDAISFSVGGGRLVGLDNGRQESAENYKAFTRTAFHGKALAIVQSDGTRGPISLTASAPGLRSQTTTVHEIGRHASGPVAIDPVPVGTPPSGPASVSADASFSGRPDTLPEEMLDGTTDSGGWSSFYVKDATALLPAVSSAHAREWVSVTWPERQTLATVKAYFTTGLTTALPAAIDVRYWNGHRFVPVHGLHVEWAAGSNEPTTISFDPIATTRVKLELTSRFPGAGNGFLQIAELQFPGS